MGSLRATHTFHCSGNRMHTRPSSISTRSPLPPSAAIGPSAAARSARLGSIRPLRAYVCCTFALHFSRSFSLLAPRRAPTSRRTAILPLLRQGRPRQNTYMRNLRNMMGICALNTTTGEIRTCCKQQVLAQLRPDLKLRLQTHGAKALSLSSLSLLKIRLFANLADGNGLDLEMAPGRSVFHFRDRIELSRSFLRPRPSQPQLIDRRQIGVRTRTRMCVKPIGCFSTETAFNAEERAGSLVRPDERRK